MAGRGHDALPSAAAPGGDPVGAAAPRAMGAFPAFQIAPRLPSIPEDGVSELCALVVTRFNGPDEDVEELLGGLRAVGRPVADARPHSHAAGYVNFMAEDDHGRVRENCGASCDRLVAIRQRYDRENLFHLNKNIPPEG